MDTIINIPTSAKTIDLTKHTPQKTVILKDHGNIAEFTASVHYPE